MCAESDPAACCVQTAGGVQVPGTFIATNYSVYFDPEDVASAPPCVAKAVADGFFSVPLATIGRCACVAVLPRGVLGLWGVSPHRPCRSLPRVDMPTSGSFRSRSKSDSSAATAIIVLTCRDGRVLHFGFNQEFHAPVARVMTQFAFPNKLAFSFAFYHWCGPTHRWWLADRMPPALTAPFMCVCMGAPTRWQARRHRTWRHRHN